MPSRNNYAAKRQRPAIRVFVSSTFSDLKLERDALARRVFPKLEQLCQTEGFQFQAIDLRWGVSTEAGLDHRTMRICFEELRRSQEVSPQPNFLILLGDRYGWRPLPEEISTDEFADLLAATQPDSDGNTIAGTGNKTAEKVLKEWYRLDTNAVPPVHVLRPRTDSPDGQDYTQVKDAEGNLLQDTNGNNQDTPAWAAVQQVLWKIIDRAFPASGLASRFDSLSTDDPSQPPKSIPSIVRFQASATEQEIWAGALTVPNAEQHVLAFFREITRCDIPVGRIANPSQVKDYFDLERDTIDATAHDAQTALKQTIDDRLGNKAVCFEARLTVEENASGQPTTTVSADHLDDLCRQVESRLTAIIDRQIKEYWDPQASEKQKSALSQTELAARDLEIERDEHVRLADEHTAHFVGRDEEGGPLKRIQAYLDDASRLPLLIHGDSGCGKTALLARAFKRAAPESNPIIRFIGVTPKSSDIRSLLGNLCLELRQLETGSDPLEGRTPGEGLTPFQSQPLPTDIHELQQEFRQHLRTAAEQQRPVVLFLDALDQLSEADGGLHVTWLPGRSSDPLPAGVKIIVSCLSDRIDDDPAGRPFAVLRDVLPEDHVFELDALPPKDAKYLLDHWLSDAGRTIGDENPNQEKQQSLINDRLAYDKQCCQPLFLKLLFEEVKLWRSYDENFRLYEPEPPDPDATTDEAARPPCSNPHVDALLRQLFARLSHSTNHGKLLVERALGYLAAARRGLSETEILEVLFADREVRHSILRKSLATGHRLPRRPRRIPIAIWSRLRSDLAPYLTERAAPGGNVLTFYHRQIAEWVKARFVDKAKWKPHGRLAEFFRRQQIWNDRHLDELPWQRQQAQHWDELKDLVTEMPVFVRLRSQESWKHDLQRNWEALKAHHNPCDAYREAIDRWCAEADSPQDLSRALNELGLFHYERAEHTAAERPYRRALAIVGRADHSNIGTCLNNLALLLQDTNRRTEAERLHRQALAIDEQAYGLKHPKVAIRLSNLATLLQELNRLTEAERLYRRALAIDEEAYGLDHPALAIRLNNLATLLENTTRLKEAELLYRRALAMDEQRQGIGCPDVARDLNNLAHVLQAMNRSAEAEPLYRRALAIEEDIYGGAHPNVAIRLSNLATLLQTTNRLAEAETLIQRALAIDEQCFGPYHPNVAVRLSILAALFQHTNRLAEAERLYRRAVAINERSYDSGHPEVARVLNDLALLLEDTNRLAEAARLMRRALAIFEQSYGPDHPEVATTLNNLANLLQRTNRLAEAEPLMRRAIVIDEQYYGASHPKAARDLSNLAQILQATNRLAEAEPLMRRVLEIYEECFGADHPNVAIALNNLAGLLTATNQFAVAEPMYRRALAINEQTYGSEHPEVANCLNNLARLLQRTSRLEEAEPLMRRHVQIYLKFAMEAHHEHPRFQPGLYNYAGLLRAMGLSNAEIRVRLSELFRAHGTALE